mmetsp:Transcript_28902/g.40691  ORF Transcript_28902/g.40691 Transcript_28902/m.40691 type:complete len:301 (-) Transcript_28902:1118-2020(-)
MSTSNGLNSSFQSRASKPWRKILYEKQPYDDNYVPDELFLRELVKNANFTEYSLPEVIRGSTLVTQQISVVVLFVTIFMFSYEGNISLLFLLSLNVVALIVGFLARMLTDKSFKVGSLLDSLRSLVLLFGCLFALSPVLGTLTAPFSDDTVAACTWVLLVIHLYFHDYMYVNGDKKKFDAPVSLNAAIFAAVLLASRLQYSYKHVFAVVAIAVELFALFPILRRSVKKYSQRLHIGLTVALALSAFGLVWCISTTLAIIFAIAVIFITIGCPFWLVFIQKYKNEIHGPWDEAVVVIRQSS